MYSDLSPYTPVPHARTRWYQRWWGRFIIVFIGLIATLAVALGFYMFKVVQLAKSGQLPSQRLVDSSGTLTPEARAVLVSTDDPTLGPKDAKVVVVEFADFQCPFCKEVKPVVKQLLADYGDRILFIYRDFPLAADHPQALIGAMAGACANDQGKFWEMHDKMFDNQSDLSEGALKIYALQIGLNTIEFNDCLYSGKHLSEIQADLNDGISLGVQATPTFFVNGYKVQGAVPLAQLERLVISELSR